MEREALRTGGTTSRRDVLGALAASSTIGVGGLAGCISRGDGGTPTPEEPPTFLLSTAQSGPYGRVGENERNGFELAVRHVNEGGGLVEAGAFDALNGDGIGGLQVETTTVDTEGSGETARSNVLPHVDDGSAAMICGGVSGSVARAHRDLAAEHDVSFMAGSTILDEFAGERCAPTTYRELYTTSALVEALGPALADAVGESATYYQIYTNAPEGEALRNAVNDYFSDADAIDWQRHGNEAIQSGTTGFDDEIERAASGHPDAVFLDLFGIDAINGLSAAVDGLPEEIQIIVPLIDDSLGSVLGSDVEGVIGTIPWDAAIDARYTDTYDSAYVSQHGPSAGGQAQTGSATAHVTYVQTLQFAAAIARAESVDPEDVRAELEGHEYDVGLGSQTLQACNHQATRSVPVVRGTSSRSSSGNYFELLELVDGVVGDCQESPGSDCSM